MAARVMAPPNPRFLIRRSPCLEIGMLSILMSQLTRHCRPQAVLQDFCLVEPGTKSAMHCFPHLAMQAAWLALEVPPFPPLPCLLYTSDAADDLLCVDL